MLVEQGEKPACLVRPGDYVPLFGYWVCVAEVDRSRDPEVALALKGRQVAVLINGEARVDVAREQMD